MAQGMVRGSIIPQYGKKKVPAKSQNPYEASIPQQASDYDEIMQRYRDYAGSPQSRGDQNLTAQYNKLLADKAPNAGLIGQYQNLANNKFTPERTSYNRTNELNTAFGNMRELSETGGYSDRDKQELRARGVSPIRSIYANAQQDMDRNRSINGGYSPNYAASSGRMAREMSEQIGNKVSDVNAGIAQNVASNRLQAAPQYTGFAQGEQRDIQNVQSENANNGIQAAALNRNTSQGALDSLQRLYNQNDANKMGALQGLQGIGGRMDDKKLEAIHGMRTTYGTTPALPQLYGQQAATQTGLDLQAKQQNQQGSGMLMNAYQQNQQMQLQKPKRPVGNNNFRLG